LADGVPLQSNSVRGRLRRIFTDHLDATGRPRAFSNLELLFSVSAGSIGSISAPSRPDCQWCA